MRLTGLRKKARRADFAAEALTGDSAGCALRRAAGNSRAAGISPYAGRERNERQQQNRADPGGLEKQGLRAGTLRHGALLRRVCDGRKFRLDKAKPRGLPPGRPGGNRQARASGFRSPCRAQLPCRRVGAEAGAPLQRGGRLLLSNGGRSRAAAPLYQHGEPHEEARGELRRGRGRIRLYPEYQGPRRGFPEQPLLAGPGEPAGVGAAVFRGGGQFLQRPRARDAAHLRRDRLLLSRGREPGRTQAFPEERHAHRGRGQRDRRFHVLSRGLAQRSYQACAGVLR